MSSKLFNLLKKEFQPKNNIPNPTISVIRVPSPAIPIINKPVDISANVVAPININQTITPGNLTALCKCSEIVVYSKPTSVKKGTNLVLSAVYPRSNSSSSTTKKKQDLTIGILGLDGSVTTEKRFIDIVPPPVPPPQNLQPGYVLYRNTNEPASRIPMRCSGLSTKKWDTS